MVNQVIKRLAGDLEMRSRIGNRDVQFLNHVFDHLARSGRVVHSH